MKKQYREFIANAVAVVLFIGGMALLSYHGPYFRLIGLYVPLAAIGGFNVMRWLINVEVERK